LWLVVALATTSVVCAGVGVAGAGLGFTATGDQVVLAQLVVLGAIAQHFPLAFGPKRKFDLSIPLHFTILLLASPPLAILLATLAEATGQVTLTWRQNRKTGKRVRGPLGAVFNTSQIALAVGLAALVRGQVVHSATGLPLAAATGLAAAASGVVLYLANTGLVAIMAALHQGKHPVRVWLSGRSWNAAQAGGLLVLGYVTSQVAHREPWVPALMLAPAALTYASLRRTAQAEAAIQARDEFLSLASHELRTPLTSVRGYAQLLRTRLPNTNAAPGKDDGAVPRAVEAIDRQSLRLCRLIEQLLDVSRVQSGKLELEQQPLDLVEVARDVVAGLQLIVPEYCLVIQANRPVEAIADRLRLEQVLTNLITNAARYARGGDQIEVEVASTRDGRALLAVRDHGQGVAPEHRARIFERYYQAQNGRPSSGLGVGLYITREIVERHGGRIALESPADGGARFVITLPAAGTRRPDTVVPNAHQSWWRALGSMMAIRRAFDLLPSEPSGRSGGVTAVHSALVPTGPTSHRGRP
jgi:signal transduction histidine kinase